MQKEILELEKILEEELEACSKLEEYITNKKTYLIKGDIVGVMSADIELEKYNSAVEKLEEKRKQIYPENLSLSQIIARIQEKNKAVEITNLKDKLNDKLHNIQKENNITSELIKNSLKILENSVTSISKVLMPENIFYNNKGRLNKDDQSEIVSSIVIEA